MADWLIRHNGKQVGPVGSAKLKELARNGRLSKDCEVQQVGTEGWHPITKIKGLFPQELIAAPAAIAVAEAPPPMTYAPQPQPIMMQPQPQMIVMQAPPAAAPVVNVTTTVVNHIHGKRFSRLVAGVLSLIIPGLGQVYKGQPINGLVWFVLVLVGYIPLVIPGLILHALCVLGAVSGRNN